MTTKDMDPVGTECFQMLNQSNWNNWKENIRFLLMDSGSWWFVDGSDPKLEDNPPRRERSQYKQREDRAFSAIYCGVDDQRKTLISSFKSASVAWTVLKNPFEHTSRASVIRVC
ncbi:hypothetical protein AVEN_88834-1 [Araneus ventricosus]|uniref:DUF4219 domain-containing protein n=1 Tax=Araneus ventricosus TaxID=182803 RepID=A0A4Y2HS84_ARAVE|nr:hypothetical protein AVEN_88834-1 [Araneus ventricosus]